MNRRMDEWTDGWVDERVRGQTCGLMDMAATWQKQPRGGSQEECARCFKFVDVAGVATFRMRRTLENAGSTKQFPGGARSVKTGDCKKAPDRRNAHLVELLGRLDADIAHPAQTLGASF